MRFDLFGFRKKKKAEADDPVRLSYRADVRDNAPVRAAFSDLARETFGIDFESWYQTGWWADGRSLYGPHVFVYEGEVVANVSSTFMTFDVFGERITAYQLGTVMTAPAWRKKGLQRELMARVLADAREADMVYLYANDTVMDFYPRFGFEPARETCWSMPVPTGAGAAVRALDMADADDAAAFLRAFDRGAPLSAVTLEGEKGIPMFYAFGALREGVRLIEEMDAVAVVEYDGDTMLIHDVFGPKGISLNEVVRALAVPGVTRAALGFTPADTAGLSAGPVEDDGGLFVLKGGKNLFSARPMRLPTLSHT